MKQKTIQFLRELHRRIHKMSVEKRLTYVNAESMDDFCLKIGYASAVAAYDELPVNIKEFVYRSKNKSNPIFYMHVGLVVTPAECLFADITKPGAKEEKFMMLVQFDKSTLDLLKEKYT